MNNNKDQNIMQALSLEFVNIISNYRWNKDYKFFCKIKIIKRDIVLFGAISRLVEIYSKYDK